MPVLVVDEEESVTLQPMLVRHSLKLQVVHVVAGLKMLLVVVVMHVEAILFSLQVSSASASSKAAVALTSAAEVP